ncbi:MAG: NAD(P)/FAD-dependent oxidoreductase [Planctomycetota bacterium]
MPTDYIDLDPQFPDGESGRPYFPLHAGRPRVMVLGCGFGGLTFCRKFRGDAEVALIDRQNHHLFQPLLYQVAMAGLAVPEVAEPIRSIFRGRKNVFTAMDEVESIDLNARRVTLRHATLEYTHLVLALGGKTSYFGNDQWAEHAPGLKTVADALRVRSRLLTSFEHAETEPDARERRRLMTVVVVGGGPTGVELAGTVADLSRQIFRKDFRHINTTNTRVILVDGSERLLESYPPELSASAKKQIEGLGVQVMLETRVTDIDAESVTLDTGERIETRNVLWGGGVVAPALTRELGVELGPGGRVKVGPDLSVPGRPEVFVIGDIAWVTNDKGDPVPGVAPAAMQMGKHVAKVLRQEIAAGATPPDQRRKFAYWDKGTMATIGRRRAVAWVGPLRFSGTLAWLAWAFIHLFFLVGFRNKIVTMVQWCFNYLAFRPGARILFSSDDAPQRV